MSKSLFSSYRLLSLAAIGATSVLVACGPDHEPLESLAAGSVSEHRIERAADGTFQLTGQIEQSQTSRRQPSMI